MNLSLNTRASQQECSPHPLPGFVASNISGTQPSSSLGTGFSRDPSLAQCHCWSRGFPPGSPIKHTGSPISSSEMFSSSNNDGVSPGTGFLPSFAGFLHYFVEYGLERSYIFFLHLAIAGKQYSCLDRFMEVVRKNNITRSLSHRIKSTPKGKVT